jgi:hypothetical protein
MRDNDPFDNAEWEAYAKHIRDELVPMIDSSAIAMSLVPKEADVKFAVELGLCIMMDKPIIAIVPSGTPVPAKIRAVADEIVEGSPGDPTFDQRLIQAMARLKAKVK